MGNLNPPAPPVFLDSGTAKRNLAVCTHEARSLTESLPRFENFVAKGGTVPLSRHPAWLTILQQGLGHTPYCLEATEEGKTRGILPLVFVRSLLFGRFLVSLPYLNYGGIEADETSAPALIDRAVQLADQFKVRYLELRHEHPFLHPALSHVRTDKVHMRRDLPATPGKLWEELDAKVRNQVRKGQKNGLSVVWGGQEVLDDFYAVFSRNMRDLGTPVYGKRLFRAILEQLPERSELCIVRAGDLPVAGALLLHGWGVTEVPSASSLRSHNSTCANMLLYWQLLERAAQRGQHVFDFGRSSEGSTTMRFKKQWGASPAASAWQFYVRAGTVGGMQKESPHYQRLIRIWQRLPLGLTRLIGPAIVRGIP